MVCVREFIYSLRFPKTARNPRLRGSVDTDTVSMDTVQHVELQPPQYLLSGLFCLKVWSHYVAQVNLKSHNPTTDLAFLYAVIIGARYHIQLEGTFS